VTEAAGPDLSVAIVTPDTYEAIRRTVGHLERQTVVDRIELVIVAPSAEDVDVPEGVLDPFQSAHIVGVGEVQSTGRALAAGFGRARAPVVVCAEEHSYPEPGWAEALIAAHRGPWVAVGAELENANPDSSISWAHLFCDFGRAVSSARPGETPELPGHHTAYKRDPLIVRYGDRLGAMLEQEWVLHDDLKAHGERLFLEPGARARHLNVSGLRSNLRSEYLAGRAFASSRARLRSWSLTRRTLYVLGSPLIPFLRLYRTIGHIRRSGKSDLLPRVLPALGSSLIAGSAGQAVGYALGPGRSTRERMSIELRRHLHLNRADRTAFGVADRHEPDAAQAAIGSVPPAGT
jgi:hypothetical protein